MTDRSETLVERRLRQAVEGRAAVAELHEKNKQIDERTARLRALRLKKEAEEAAMNPKSRKRRSG